MDEEEAIHHSKEAFMFNDACGYLECRNVIGDTGDASPGSRDGEISLDLVLPTRARMQTMSITSRE